jgi:hypothetical protein
MGEILGLGLSHYPGPTVPAEHWPHLMRRNVEIGRIPAEAFADRAAWPAPMRAEWGDDEGVGAAREHSRRLASGYARLRAELDAFAPDLVLIWGDDQYENFRKDGIPPFCVYILDEVKSRPYGGSFRLFNTNENVWGLPVDAEITVRGHADAASALCRTLLENEFDVAYATQTRHAAGLAHSFANTILYLDYNGAGFDYPVIPFHVNCYGNQLLQTAAGAVGEGVALHAPPAPSPKRCFDIGRAVARFFAASPWRVALIASSSWSHASLTTKHRRLFPDILADRARFEDLRDGGFTAWRGLDLAQIEDSGQHEILNWVCLAGAMTELERSAEIVDFVESYIFNSSKCFALFPSPTAA